MKICKAASEVIVRMMDDNGKNENDDDNDKQK